MSFAGMTPTGRKVSGPGADLVELDAPTGLKHTAVQFAPDLREEPALDAGIQPSLAFLEKPGVSGIAPLALHLPDEGAFVYPTGTIVTLAEVIRTYADLGLSPGIKAGLELVYLAGEILSEAATAAEAQTTLRCHGSINPWRVALKPDGQILLLGYGVPPAEVTSWVHHQRGNPREDSFRYAPPERLDREASENVHSDLFSLALLAAELMIGRPVYDGVLADVRQQAARGEAVRRLYQLRDKMPDPVREVLVRALKPDIDARYRQGGDFVYAAHDLLTSVDADGPSLADVVKKTRAVAKRGKFAVGGQTGSLTPEELALVAADFDDSPTAAAPGPRMGRPEAPPEPVEEQAPSRWAKVSRPGRDPSEVTRTSQLSGPAAELRERLRRPEPPAAAPAPPGGEESARDRLRRRLREKSAAVEATGAIPMVPRPAQPPTPPPAPPRSAAPAPQPEPEPPPPAAEPVNRPEETAPSPPRASADAQNAAVALLERLRATAPARPRLSDGGPPTAGPAVFRLEILVDGAVVHASVAPDATLAEAGARAAEAAGLPTDLLGTLTGWWRIEQDGRRWPSDEPVSVLDASRPVSLAFVPNRIVTATVEVHGVAEPIRFQTPVGTAVPARSLLEHLRRWLGLPAASWTLSAGGRPLAPLQTLDDAGVSGPTTLVVSR